MVSRTMQILKKASKINSETDYCVDVDLSGNFNSVEVRVYPSKDIIQASYILYETIDLCGDSIFDDEKLEDIEILIDKLLKQTKND